MGPQEGHRSKSPFLVWKAVVHEPWEIRVYCGGCLSNGNTITMSLLDAITNVPTKERFQVARLLRDSVGCPMPGPSHRKVVVKAFRVLTDGSTQPARLRAA